MPQIFSPRADGLARIGLLTSLVLAALLLVAAILFSRSDWVAGVAFAADQPVPFSHQHHVGGLGLDCRYCHQSVERSAFAGLPATEVCMTCHSQLYTGAAMLAPVRDSLASGAPIAWNRVHDLPDYVYFDHSVHVNNGVGCETCHGDVSEMPLMGKSATLVMAWCLDCHEDPEPNLRPPEAIFVTPWRPPKDVASVRADLMRRYDIDPATLTDCYVCHR